MAILQDTVVTGSLRATDTLYSTTNQFQILKIPTTSGGSTYGAGADGQVLMSNGTSSYWGTPTSIELIVSTNAAASTTLSGVSDNLPFTSGTILLYLTTYTISEGTQTVSFTNTAGTTTATGTLYVANGTASTQAYAAGIFLPLIYYNNNFYVIQAFPTLPMATGVSF